MNEIENNENDIISDEEKQKIYKENLLIEEINDKYLDDFSNLFDEDNYF